MIIVSTISVIQLTMYVQYYRMVDEKYLHYLYIFRKYFTAYGMV